MTALTAARCAGNSERCHRLHGATRETRMPARLKTYRAVAHLLGVLDGLGWRVGYRYGDRQLLEKVILPSLAADVGAGHVLLVGCAWYTRDYPEFFARARV